METLPRNANGVDFSGEPLALLRRGVFPVDWALVPVHGKDTYVKKWTTQRLDRERLIEEYKGNSSYRGLGVVTGAFSGGLLALDIDGPTADERYRQVAGSEYEPYSEESTMSWTSGKEGRRQLLYQVPTDLVEQLSKVRKVILRLDGQWHLGSGDTERGAGGEKTTAGEKYEEVVLRFNGCQSVLPGSPHPETHKRYRFLNYNNGQVAPAPRWVISVLLGFSTPVQWLDPEAQTELEAELGGGSMLPAKQARGWFFKEEVQQKLSPRLEELVFNDEVFSDYGWKDRDGDPPQRLSGCPWHGGSSGTSFQYNLGNGNWYCHACGVGGDLLDYIHKRRTGDMHAGRPPGEKVVTYIAELATALGYEFPACAKAVEVHTKEIEKERIPMRRLLDAAKQIIKEVRNPAEQHLALMDLAEQAGRYRLDAKTLRTMARRDSLYDSVKDAGIHVPHGWSQAVDAEDFIIPGFLRKPSQIMLHARGGVGKSEMALALAKAVGRGESITIRGLKVQCRQGRVLWFSGDQGKSRLASMLLRQGIDEAGKDSHWFELMSGWKIDQHEEFREQVFKHQPSVIVMDSLGTMLEGAAKENEGEYADWVYQLANLNGDTAAPGGFPAVAIIWIHHNVKSGDTFRGSDRLNNAMDETWALRELTEEEEAELGVNRRILTVGKSRFDRSGDRLIVHRDLEFNFSISDMTPLIQKEGVSRNGDSTPETLVLAILAAAGEPLTREEILTRLHDRMRGEGRRERELPTEWGLRKYLAIWLTDGLVEEVPLPSSGRGRPKKGFLARGGDTSASHKKSPGGSDPLEGLEFDFLRGGHKKASEGGSSQKIPTELGEAAADSVLFSNGSPHLVDGISVSEAPNGAAHKKSAAETPSAATDPESGDFLCETEVPHRTRGADLTEDVTYEQSPHVDRSEPQANTPGRPGAAGALGRPGGGDRAEPLEEVRPPHRSPLSGEGDQGAESLRDPGAPSDAGVAGAEGRLSGAVQAPREELPQAGAVGAEVPGGQVHRGPALGADQPLEAHDGSASDSSDVLDADEAQAIQPQGLVGPGAEAVKPRWQLGDWSSVDWGGLSRS